MKTYRISFSDGLFSGGVLDVQAKTKRKAIKTLEKDLGMKIIVQKILDVKKIK